MNQKYESLELGQFIPLHYHYNMLNDTVRTQGFKQAIDFLVKPGDKVLELGGGTGVQSFFAAQKAEKVWCVERNPALIKAARDILAVNPNHDKIDIVQADAASYLPPEPVDVVICEMLHTGLLREKQLPILNSFKQNYIKKFGPKLPLFIPEASIQAVQPVHQDFDFEGFYAPTILFQDPTCVQPRTRELAAPSIFQLVTYEEHFDQHCHWQGVLNISESGKLNAIRMITKNILAVNVAEGTTIDWHTQHIIFPLQTPLVVEKGDNIEMSFSYQAGDPLNAFSDSLCLSHQQIIDERRVHLGL